MLAMEKQAEFVFILINVIVRMPCGLLPITFQPPANIVKKQQGKFAMISCSDSGEISFFSLCF